MSASNYQRARNILQSLVQGVDPDTRADLPADTILHRVEVVRAMLTAIDALENVDSRTQRRALLPESAGKTWDEAEERQLVEAISSGDPIPTIAERHGRTIRAIEARLEKLGLLPSDQRTTPKSLMGAGGKEET